MEVQEENMRDNRKRQRKEDVEDEQRKPGAGRGTVNQRLGMEDR